MSDYARDAVWQTRGLTFIQRLLLLAIAENCGDKGNESIPVSEASLASMCECSKEWVQRQIRPLEDRGILEVLRQHPGEGHFENKYRLMHPDGLAEAERDLPSDLREKQRAPDPLELKKKRDGSRNSGGFFLEKRASSLHDASGLSLNSTAKPTGYWMTSAIVR